MANQAGLNMNISLMTGSVLHIGPRQARTIIEERPRRFSFFLQVDARQCPTPRSGSWPRSFQGHIETLLREGSKSCVPLAIPSDVSHISRPERIRALDIGRFEIAQKRLLASWSDVLDLSDIPETGTQAFIAASTDEQRLHHQQLQTDEERLKHQTTLREQTITNRKAQHQLDFPLSDNLMSLIFLVQSDLNEQQRERFVSSMNIRQIAIMPQYTYLHVKQLFLELFCVSRTGRCCRPRYTESSRPSTSSKKARPTKVNAASGSLTKRLEKKVSQVCIQRTNFGFKAQRDHTLSADCTADHLRKESRRAMARKEKDQDPASVRDQREKVMQHGTMTSKAHSFLGKRKRQKGQERNERKGFFQRNAFTEGKRQRRWQEQRRKTISTTTTTTSTSKCSSASIF